MDIMPKGMQQHMVTMIARGRYVDGRLPEGRLHGVSVSVMFPVWSWPQAVQNLAPSGSSVPHFLQYIVQFLEKRECLVGVDEFFPETLFGHCEHHYSLHHHKD